MSNTAQRLVAQMIVNTIGFNETPPSEELLRAKLEEIIGPEPRTLEEKLQHIPESKREARRQFSISTGFSPTNDLRYYDWVRANTLPTGS